MNSPSPTSLNREERNDYLERREQDRQFRSDTFSRRSRPFATEEDRRKISAWLQGGLRQHIQDQHDQDNPNRPVTSDRPFPSP